MKAKRAIPHLLLLATIMLPGRALAGTPNINETLIKETIPVKGKRYKETIPDTLDLAERAELSINALTHNINPEKFYSVYQALLFGPDRFETIALSWNNTPKNIRPLPLMRTMCGSKRWLDLEYELMRTVLRQVNEDGQLYFPYGKDGMPEDTSYPFKSGTAGLAMLNWYERDGNPAWLNWVALLAKGLRTTAIQVEDRAYYPPECGYGRDGQWHWTTRANSKPSYPYTPPEEPDFDQQVYEGCVKLEQAHPFRLMVKYHEMTGDRACLEMARKIARFILKPGLWEDTSREGYPGNEHGIWGGHFTGNIITLHALLDLAVADHNDWLKQFVREGYSNAVRNGVVRIGWFPAWTTPVRYKRWEDLHRTTELCAVANMVVLAVKLSDAGLGDYWDDVDSIVRNQLTAQQFIDLDLMRQAAGGDPDHDPMLKRFLGGFGPARPTHNRPVVWACCTVDGAMGLYYAWHGITRFHDGVAKVNLFLNRASSWMDIDSYLPYEGKVVLHNKKAHTALVRIPVWLEPDAVQCYVDEKAVKPLCSNGYLIFKELNPTDRIRLEFAMPESTAKYTIHDETHTVSFHGSALMDIQPREDTTGVYPIYQRERYKATQTPMKTVERFAPDKVLPLQ